MKSARLSAPRASQNLRRQRSGIAEFVRKYGDLGVFSTVLRIPRRSLLRRRSAVFPVGLLGIPRYSCRRQGRNGSKQSQYYSCALNQWVIRSISQVHYTTHNSQLTIDIWINRTTGLKFL